MTKKNPTKSELRLRNERQKTYLIILTFLSVYLLALTVSFAVTSTNQFKENNLMTDFIGENSFNKTIKIDCVVDTEIKDLGISDSMFHMEINVTNYTSYKKLKKLYEKEFQNSWRSCVVE